MPLSVRDATLDDAPAITAIYNEGIASRRATFDTEPCSVEEIADDLRADMPTHPTLVVVDGERVVGFAWASPYRARSCYVGIAEFSVYVAGDARRRGVGRLALSSLVERCERLGFWKLLSRVFTDNLPSRALCAELSFREVGIYRHHARLEGVWKDCVIVERLLGEAAKESVLFVCIHNSARSQMAEAFVNSRYGDRLEAFSAGLEAGRLNPTVVEVMREVGIDIAGNRTKSVDDPEVRAREYDYVVTVCDEASAEACPIYPTRGERLHWSFADPSTFEGDGETRLALTREVRDAIAARLDAWLGRPSETDRHTLAR